MNDYEHLPDLNMTSHVVDHAVTLSDDTSVTLALVRQLEDSAEVYLHVLRSTFFPLRLQLVFENIVGALEKERAREGKNRKRSTVLGR